MDYLITSLSTIHFKKSDKQNVKNGFNVLDIIPDGHSFDFDFEFSVENDGLL